MSESAIKEQIKLILSTSTGANNTNLKPGRIHDYRRWANNWDDYLDLFKDQDDKVNAWIISRVSCAEKMLTMPSENLVAIEWNIYGIYGLNDSLASEIDFQDLIDGIRAKFRINRNLNSTCDTIRPEWGPMAGLYGIQSPLIGYARFGGVLCHYTELKLGTQHRESRV